MQRRSLKRATPKGAPKAKAAPAATNPKSKAAAKKRKAEKEEEETAEPAFFYKATGQKA